jgi:hypothetical protein
VTDERASGGTSIKVPFGLARVKRVLRPVMSLLALAFVAVAGWDLSRRWQSAHVDVDFVMAALSTLPLVAGVLILALGWAWLLARLTHSKVPTLEAMALHVESQAARYTPGKVGMPLVRMLGAEQLGATSRVVGSSVLIELLCWVAVGGACAFALLGATGDMARGATETLGDWGLLLLAAFVVALALLLWVDRQRLPPKVRALLELEGAGPLVPARLPLIHVLYWLTWAIHGYLTSRAVHAPEPVALASAGLYVLAPVLGFLALAAPGGIGVREAVLSIGLSASVGPAAALYAALLSRITSVLVDVGMWLALRPFRGRAIRLDE